MKEFPNRMHVTNVENFPELFYERYICYLRRDIFEHILKRNGDENDYVCLDSWCRNNIQNRKDIMCQMRDTVINEIEDKGWKCKLSFGGTGLFIYSTEDPPPSCHEDGF